MINTEKVIGYYEDVFGNEVDIYEEIERYTVFYEGYLFEGDEENKWNEHGYDRWDDVKSLINAYGDMIHVRDNEYGCVFERGEWN